MSQDISLLNTVIGPVMRGPSSSHSAAPYMIGKTVRELAMTRGNQIVSATVKFDPSGSFAEVYRNQGSDEGFAAGLSGVAITSEAYKEALKHLESDGDFAFAIEITALGRNDHPNRVDLKLTIRSTTGETRVDMFEAVSLGGGVFLVTRCNDQRINVDGTAFSLLIEHEKSDVSILDSLLAGVADLLDVRKQPGLTVCALGSEASSSLLERLVALPGVTRVRCARPTQEVVRNREKTLHGAEHLLQIVGDDADLAEYALAYESDRLRMGRREVMQRFDQRVALMARTVEDGLRAEDPAGMKYLKPTARRFANATLPGPLDNSFLKDAIAGALAAMEQTTSRGVMCAAPTAGSAGIVPGCLHALRKLGATDEQASRCLMVMALIGGLFAVRGSYAAETGGCSVETGTSAAMAAAGLTYFFGGSPKQIIDAASLCLMNTLGLICDPVGGEVEIPCHARNIAGVSHAWSATIAALGGFDAVIPFDELVEQTVKVGEKMHPDLRCTARGGCAATPTAVRFVRASVARTDGGQTVSQVEDLA